MVNNGIDCVLIAHVLFEVLLPSPAQDKIGLEDFGVGQCSLTIFLSLNEIVNTIAQLSKNEEWWEPSVKNHDHTMTVQVGK